MQGFTEIVANLVSLPQCDLTLLSSSGQTASQLALDRGHVSIAEIIDSEIGRRNTKQTSFIKLSNAAIEQRFSEIKIG